MKHEFAAVLIDLDDRITPAEIGVEMLKPDGHVHRGHCRNKPSRILEQHGKPPPFSGMTAFTHHGITAAHLLYSVVKISMKYLKRANCDNNVILLKPKKLGPLRQFFDTSFRGVPLIAGTAKLGGNRERKYEDGSEGEEDLSHRCKRLTTESQLTRQ
jgi:hypothetical protein